MVGDERLVRRLDDGELETEALGIAEAEAALAPLDGDVLRGEPVVPELDRILRRDPQDDAVHHPATGPPRPCVGILEEREIAAGAALLVGVEQVVDRGVVLVHGLLHESEAQHADVEVDVAGGVTGDAGDVVDALEPHRVTVTIDS